MTKKQPPSKFPDDGNKQQQQKPTKGIMILTDDNMTNIKVVEDFSYDDVEYKPTPGLVSNLILKASKELEVQSIAQSVMQNLLNMDIQVSNATQGTIKLKFPDFLANMIVNIMHQKAADARLKSNIILPQGGRG